MLKPLGNLALVKPMAEEERKTDSGIIVVGKEKLVKGEVIEVSKTLISDLKPGAIVLYKNGRGLPVTDEGKDYLLLQEQSIDPEIVAVIQKP